MNLFAPKYDVLQTFLSSPSDLTYGQLLRGEADMAQQNLCKVIKDQKVRKNVVISTTSALKRLKLVKVDIHGDQV